MITKVGTRCRPTYSFKAEEKEDFSAAWKPPSANETCSEDGDNADFCPWQHYSSRLLSNPSVRGANSLSYAGGGFVVQWDMNDKENAINVTRDLQDNNWLDEFTAALFVEFTLYNANINLFTYVSYLLEFPSTGNIDPFPTLYTFRLYDYTSTEDFQAITVTLTYVIFVMTLLYFIIREIDDMKRSGKGYLLSASNWLEILIIATGSMVLLGYLVRKVLVDAISRELQEANGSGKTRSETLGKFFVGWLTSRDNSLNTFHLP